MNGLTKKENCSALQKQMQMDSCKVNTDPQAWVKCNNKVAKKTASASTFKDAIVSKRNKVNDDKSHKTVSFE